MFVKHVTSCAQHPILPGFQFLSSPFCSSTTSAGPPYPLTFPSLSSFPALVGANVKFLKYARRENLWSLAERNGKSNMPLTFFFQHSKSMILSNLRKKSTRKLLFPVFIHLVPSPPPPPFFNSPLLPFLNFFLTPWSCKSQFNADFSCLM